MEGEWRGRKRQLVINMCVEILALCDRAILSTDKKSTNLCVYNE